MKKSNSRESEIEKIISKINSISEINEKIDFLNELKKAIHDVSPFNSEPVDCVLWVKSDEIHANDYNPNSVATKEMDLLYLSIKEDGYTQPIVTFKEDITREVVDGFHRSKVARFYPDINERILGYMPVVTINADRTDKSDRMAATIRHNRARGKHAVESMSDIVMELKKRNWSDEKIGRELGMEPDEVLRLAQITGLSEIFSDQEFSEAWEIREDEEDNFELND